MTRTEIINHVIKAGGYTSYLEVGVRNPADNFNRIDVQTRWGCDPAVNAEFVSPCTSNEYFDYCAMVGIKWDVIFIDGDHSYPQCTTDMVKAMRHLNQGGCVILHDTLPKSEAAQVNIKPDNGEAWNGQAWRSVVEARRRGYKVMTVGCDHGVTLLQDGGITCAFLSLLEASWSAYNANAKELANVVTPQFFMENVAGWLDTGAVEA